MPLLCPSYCTNVKNLLILAGGNFEVERKMSKERRCSGMAVQDGLNQSMSGCSAWQSSCTWLFGPAADLLSCVHWLTSRLGSSLDINNCRFSVGFSVHCIRYDFFHSPDSVVPFQYLRGATSLSEPLSPPVLHT